MLLSEAAGSSNYCPEDFTLEGLNNGSEMKSSSEGK